jgi:hypothetical protein
MTPNELDIGVAILASTARVSTPLMFAALGGLMSERAGVINIALEGKMLVGAFAAAVGTLQAAELFKGALHAAWLVPLSPWLGAAFGMLAGALIAALYGLLVIRLRSNQIVAGTAINMLALGLTPFLCNLIYGQTGNSTALPLDERFRSAPLYLCWLLAIGLFFWLRHTRQGLWLSFAGENPQALAASRHPSEWCQMVRRPVLRSICRVGWRCALHFPLILLLAQHDCRTRIHRSRRTDLWEMEANPHRPCLPPLRLLRRHPNPAAGRNRAGSRRSGSNHPDTPLRRHGSRTRGLRRQV